MIKVAVFGAGAIGCWIGGRLAAGGADVTLIGRPRLMAELEGGLELTELGGARWKVAPKRATEAAAAADADVVLVTVKSADTARAGEALAAVVGERAVIASFQNGVRNAAVLRDALPGRRVLAGMVVYNVARVGPGRYHRGTGGDLVVEASPAAEPLLAACRSAGLDITARADITAVQWGKLVMNLNNAINALSGRPLAAEIADRDFRRVFSAAMHEALDALATAHQPVAGILRVPPRWVARILPLPDWAFRRIAGRVADVDPTARSSMADDLAAGRPTEVDYLQGEVVALAARTGTRAPISERLAALVHAAETGGKRTFTGAELRATLAAPRQGAAHSATAAAAAIEPTSNPSRNRP